ncbi:MAG: flagellar hook assembly protein FlgD [Armatimonadetes bacterium]|nr:flagellar hook assembly protein FlgD [Armatimonadota bacterium]
MMTTSVSSSLLYGSAAMKDRKPSAELDSQAFMQLLVAQLQNQDPLNSMDQNQFMQQLATMNSMQQQLELNSQLKSLVQSDQLSRALGLIGRTVSGTDGDRTLQGQVTGVTVSGGAVQLKLGDQVLPFAGLTTVT